MYIDLSQLENTPESHTPEPQLSARLRTPSKAMLSNVTGKRVGHQPKRARELDLSHIQPPTMPLIRSQSSRKSVEQEGSILVAIQAIQNEEISSIREVAHRFNVPRSSGCGTMYIVSVPPGN